MRHRIFFILCFCLLLMVPTGHADAKRVALVVGNSAYEHVATLKNPRNDASAVASALRKLGFEVIEGIDLKRLQLETKVREFSRAAQGAKVALFYYAGHGVQVGGRNFLAPVDAELASETDLDFQTVSLDAVIRSMERERRTNLVFLDACRDNPLARNLARSMGTRSAAVGRGLARIKSGVGTLIAFATQPGNVALDGDGANSPFTSALLQHIESPGLDVALLMRRVRTDVMSATNDRQVPWSNSSLTGTFSFREAGTPKTPSAPTPPAVDMAARTWSVIENTKSRAVLEAFVKQFPDSVFAAFAKARLTELKEPKVAVGQFPKPPEPPKPEIPRSLPPMPQPLPEAPREPETVSLQAALWPVGKWPEGIVSDGRSLWIAESGQRRIAQLDMNTGRVVKRVKVGRLPVDMKATSDGRVYALVYTDQNVWSQPKRGRGRRLARLRDYPEGMVGDDRTLWILTHPGGSSATAKVVRLDQRSGRAKGSNILTQNAAGLAVAHGKVWVVHGTGKAGQLSLLDPDSLANVGRIGINGFVTKIAANGRGIFAAGGEWDKSGLVIKFDGATGREAARRALPDQFIYGLGADENHVIAIGRQGRIWILSPEDLSIRRVLDLSVGAFAPASILATTETLFITTHRGQGQNGSVVVVKGWRP